MSKVKMLGAVTHPVNKICGSFANKAKQAGEYYYAPARTGEYVVLVKDDQVGIYHGKPRLFLKEKSLEHIKFYSQSESDECLGDTIVKLVDKMSELTK